MREHKVISFVFNSQTRNNSHAMIRARVPGLGKAASEVLSCSHRSLVLLLPPNRLGSILYPYVQNSDTESYAKDLLLSGAHGKRKYLYKSEERDFWPISIS